MSFWVIFHAYRAVGLFHARMEELYLHAEAVATDERHLEVLERNEEYFTSLGVDARSEYDEVCAGARQSIGMSYALWRHVSRNVSEERRNAILSAAREEVRERPIDRKTEHLLMRLLSEHQ